MIFDKITNLDKYGLDCSFILDDLSKKIFSSGKYLIDGDNKFGIDLIYSTKPESEGLWEAHRKYIDIHVVISGEEFVSICDIKQAKSTKDYEEDYEIFDAIQEHKILLKEGSFLILFPNEVHKTGVIVNSETEVRKKVYKLLINE